MPDLPHDHHEDPQDHQLDALFARARQPTPADLGAAERFVLRQRRATEQRWRLGLRLGLSGALASAAALGGLLAFWPAPASHDLPASAAYSVYRSALGDGW